MLQLIWQDDINLIFCGVRTASCGDPRCGFSCYSFIINGEKKSKPAQSSSTGCPVFESLLRNKVAKRGERTLKVVPFGTQFKIEPIPTKRKVMP
jgi:hypothetical protein